MKIETHIDPVTKEQTLNHLLNMFLKAYESNPENDGVTPTNAQGIPIKDENGEAEPGLTLYIQKFGQFRTRTGPGGTTRLTHMGFSRPEARDLNYKYGLYRAELSRFLTPEEREEYQQRRLESQERARERRGDDFEERTLGNSWRRSQGIFLLSTAMGSQNIVGKRFIQELSKIDEDVYEGDYHPLLTFNDIVEFFDNQDEDGAKCKKALIRLMTVHNMNPHNTFILPFYSRPARGETAGSGWWARDLPFHHMNENPRSQEEQEKEASANLGDEEPPI